MAEPLCPACGAGDCEAAGRYRGRSGTIFSALRLARCPSCGLVFADPLPDRRRLDEYYRSSYWLGDVAAINPVTEAYYLAQSAARLDFLKSGSEKLRSALDIGAGSGAMLEALRRRGISASYDVIEPDESQAKVISSWKAGRVFRSLGELSNGERYDLIVLSHVLEHVPEPAGFIESIVGKLGPGGALFVEVPNGDHEYKHDFEPHVLFFSPGSLRSLLAEHGSVGRIAVCGKPQEELRARFALERSARGGWKSLLPAPAKAWLKRVLGRDRLPSLEELRESYALDVYGEGRQWIRAVIGR